MQVSGVGLYYSQDLKLAHYQKVPPRATFFGESFEVIGAYCEFLSDIVCPRPQSSSSRPR